MNHLGISNGITGIILPCDGYSICSCLCEFKLTAGAVWCTNRNIAQRNSLTSLFHCPCQICVGHILRCRLCFYCFTSIRFIRHSQCNIAIFVIREIKLNSISNVALIVHTIMVRIVCKTHFGINPRC